MIHYYYGFGKGKTSSAIGAGIRAYGAGIKVSLIQFLKDNKSNELNVVPFEVFEAPKSLPFNPSKQEYQSWVDKACEYINNTDSQFIILDEFVDVIGKFISIDEAISLFKSDKEYILTGHYRIEELIDISDYVTVFEKEKHPFDKGINARKGIEF